MPHYKCLRFNRTANSPSRMCECGQLVTPASHGSRNFVCPTHGLVTNPKLCDCEGCQKSIATRQKSERKTRPWKYADLAPTDPNRQEHLQKAQQYQSKYLERLRNKEIKVSTHQCPTCGRFEVCNDPSSSYVEEPPNAPNPYAHCPINEAIDNQSNKFGDKIVKRACGGFWPDYSKVTRRNWPINYQMPPDTQPSPEEMEELQLKAHIYFYHDLSNKDLYPEVKIQPIKFERISHRCSSCDSQWPTVYQLSPSWPVPEIMSFRDTSSPVTRVRNYLKGE